MANETWYRVAMHGLTIDEVTVVRKFKTSIWLLGVDGRTERADIDSLQVTYFENRDKAISAMLKHAQRNVRVAQNNLNRAQEQLAAAQRYREQAQPA